MITIRQKTGWKGKAAAAGTTAFLAVVVAASVAAQQWMQTGGTMTEQNKAVAVRWSEELWSNGQLAVADEIVAPDYVRHDPGDPFPAQGPEDVKRIVKMLRIDAARPSHQRRSHDRRRRFRRQPLHRDRDRHRWLHGHAADREDRANAGDSDLPILQRQDCRELGRAG